MDVIQSDDMPPTPKQMPLDLVAGEVSEAYPEPKLVMAGQYDVDDTDSIASHVKPYLHFSLSLNECMVLDTTDNTACHTE